MRNRETSGRLQFSHTFYAVLPGVCRYKFCVAMENSIRQDYMTEKLWDALAAGCIPIYLGSKNAPHIIPDPQSIIM